MSNDRDEAIRLARKCGASLLIKGAALSFDELESFYLAAKAKGSEEENEACEKVCDDAINKISDAAVIGDDRKDAGINACANLAAAIRARKEKKC